MKEKTLRTLLIILTLGFIINVASVCYVWYRQIKADRDIAIISWALLRYMR